MYLIDTFIMGTVWSDIRASTWEEASIYVKRRDTDKLIALYDTAIQQNPSCTTLYGDKATLLDRMNESPQAIDGYNDAIVFDPSNAVNHQTSKGQVLKLRVWGR